MASVPIGWVLADGSYWELTGANRKGAILIGHLARLANLAPSNSLKPRSDQNPFPQCISVGCVSRDVRWPEIPRGNDFKISCRVGPFPTPAKLALQLARIAQVVVQGSEGRGGLLVHGALAEWKGNGVILAGPGGVGKSTASRRLPKPWRSLSDDTALIAKAADGSYWAHPWPTWSRIRRGAAHRSWDVQKAVKLKLICMLEQKRLDRMEKLPYLQAISELVDIAGQAFVIVANGLDIAAFRRVNLARFHNTERIAKHVPVFRLEISRHGRFWEVIEDHLGRESLAL